MESQISNLLALGVVAGLLNAIIGLTSKYFKSSNGKKLAVAGLSILLGGLYWGVSHTAYVNSVIAVLGVSQIFYAFFIKK